MLIKSADDKQPQIDALTALLARPDVPADTRKRIELEIKKVRAGAAGERDAAYEIEFQYGKHRNQVTIHDLRLEVDGRTAQIDHLVVTRLLDVWVLESKHFSQGVKIDEHGEWTTFFGRVPQGIASPIEQYRRHVAVLRDAFGQGLVPLPKRFGAIPIKPRVTGLVIVSNSASIQRPRGRAADRVDGLDTVIKVERLHKTIDDDFERRNVAMAKLVGQERLEQLGRDLAALHKPISVD